MRIVLSIDLPVSLYLFPSIYLSFYLAQPVYPSRSIFLSICLDIFLSPAQSGVCSYTGRPSFFFSFLLASDQVYRHSDFNPPQFSLLRTRVSDEDDDGNGFLESRLPR